MQQEMAIVSHIYINSLELRGLLYRSSLNALSYSFWDHSCLRYRCKDIFSNSGVALGESGLARYYVARRWKLVPDA